MNVSRFFARSRLSKLSLLSLTGDFQISSWKYLASQTTLLTTLSITDRRSLPFPTASQLYLILSSNPNLRRLTLSYAAIPQDTDGSTSRVPLPNLKRLNLSGEFCHLFGLLRRLILPEVLDEMCLLGFRSTVHDVSQTLAPYMRDYFRRDDRFRNNLEISSSFSTSLISLSVDVVGTQSTAPAKESPRVVFGVTPTPLPPPDVLEQLAVNFVAPLPREHVVSFEDRVGRKLPEELFFMMPNIKTLHIHGAELPEGFLQPNPDGPHANTKLLPSLRFLCLKGVTLNDDDWGRLTKYLVHQTSDGQTISLEVGGYSPHPCPEVANEIENLIENFAYDFLYPENSN